MDNSGFDNTALLALSGLNSREQFDDDDELFEYDPDDDDDDESYFEEDAYDDDDERFFGEFGDDDDDEAYFGEDDDDDDEGFIDADMADDAERKRRGRRFGRRWRRGLRRRSYKRPSYRRYGRSRRLRKPRGRSSTMLRSATGQKMRVRFGTKFATASEVKKLITDTEKKFADAMKERKANFNRLSQQIAKATKNLDNKVSAMGSRVSSVNSKVKKVEEQSRNSALIGLLQGAPEVEEVKLNANLSVTDNELKAGTVLPAEVTFKKPDILLPLALSGGLTGGGSGGSNNMLLLALALGDRK